MSTLAFWAPLAPPIIFFAIIAALTVVGSWMEKLQDRANARRYTKWLAAHPGGTYRQYLKEICK